MTMNRYLKKRGRIKGGTRRTGYGGSEREMCPWAISKYFGD
jgi:hypothetical protein